VPEIFSVFLGKVPEETDISEIKEHLMLIEGICDVHHIHILKHGSGNILATMHIVTDENSSEIKAKVREELIEHGISHVTLEIEGTNENCNNRVCNISHKSGYAHSHGHCHH
jgi:cobalt-zinc-cadmium efflux system protein